MSGVRDSKQGRGGRGQRSGNTDVDGGRTQTDGLREVKDRQSCGYKHRGTRKNRIVANVHNINNIALYEHHIYKKMSNIFSVILWIWKTPPHIHIA